jgi:pimeloyl-ACP methyl ester carboxylesterase
MLAEHFRVVAYDRRGHSRSERPARGWTRRDNEDDLIALVEALDLAPAHVVGNSYAAWSR